MAIFVVSDIHGHARAFDRALELAQPGSDDTEARYTNPNVQVDL